MGAEWISEREKGMIINLTRHQGTPEQNVADLQGDGLEALKEALTFDSLPSGEEILGRAEYIAELAVHNGLGGDDGEDPFPTSAMIGGAPWLMRALESALMARGITPVYASFVRERVDAVGADGATWKTSVLRHVGFIHMIT